MVFPFGALAPDGRESGHQWHSRGQRFDPAYLHQKQQTARPTPCGFAISSFGHISQRTDLQKCGSVLFLPWLKSQGFLFSQGRSHTMIFSNEPDQIELERIMTQPPFYRPRGQGKYVIKKLLPDKESCNCGYCLYADRKNVHSRNVLIAVCSRSTV